MQIGRNENANEKRRNLQELNYLKYLINGPSKETQLKYTAPDGSKVIEREKEKSEVIKKLNIERIEEITGIKMYDITKNGARKYNRNFGNELDRIIKSGESEYINQSIEEWRDGLLKTIPRYFTIDYNKEEGMVEVTICSEADNIKTLYNQSSIKRVQRDVEKKVNRLVELGIISDTPTTLQISEEDCSKFFVFSQTKGKKQPTTFLEIREKIDKKLEEDRLNKQMKIPNFDGDQQE